MQVLGNQIQKPAREVNKPANQQILRIFCVAGFCCHPRT